MLSQDMFDHLREAEHYAFRLQSGPVITDESLHTATELSKNLAPGKSITIQKVISPEIGIAIADQLPDNCTLILNHNIPSELALVTVARLKPGRILILDNAMPIEVMKQVVAILPVGCIYKLAQQTYTHIAIEVVPSLPAGCILRFANKTPRHRKEAVLDILPRGVRHETESNTDSLYNDLISEAFYGRGCMIENNGPELAVRFASENIPGQPVLINHDVPLDIVEAVFSHLPPRSHIVLDPCMPQALAEAISERLNPASHLIVDNTMPLAILEAVATRIPAGCTLRLTDRIPAPQREILIARLAVGVEHVLDTDPEVEVSNASIASMFGISEEALNNLEKLNPSAPAECIIM